MGTSSSYTGPIGKPPLLPPWAPDPFPTPEPAPPEPLKPPEPPEQLGKPNPIGSKPEIIPDALGSGAKGLPTPMQLPQVEWRMPKSALSRVARGAAATSLASVAHAYVRAHGGSRPAAASAVQGRATTARLAGFLAAGKQTGFAQAATVIGLQPLLGQDAESFLAAFIDLLAPDGAMLEEAAARTAFIETSIELFERYEVAEKGISGLDAIDAEGIWDIVSLSVTNYVNARLQQELVSRVERAMLPEHEANLLMDQLKDFVASVVHFDLRDRDVLVIDWGGTEGATIVASIYATGYELLGDAQ